MNKEIQDALSCLLSMALENDKYESQKEQYKIVNDYITKLQQENYNLKNVTFTGRNYNEVLKSEQDYKSRNEKAIEYVKSKKAIINTDYIRIFDLFKIDEQGYTDELLEILKGSDK